MADPEITIDGVPTRVRAGTSVAVAVLAAGVRAFRRSVGGSARAPLCGMGTCFECRLTIDGVAHRRSCQIECREGMRIETGDHYEGGDHDEGSVELGGASEDSWSLQTEILVVGAGPAGVAAAVRAAEAGKNVILVDDNAATGGQIWRATRRSDAALRTPTRKSHWLERLDESGARVITGTTVVSCDGPHSLRADREEGTVDLRCETLVVATGARERMLPFPGWTEPGVVGIGGLQALLKSGLDISGQRVAFVGSGPLMLAVAAAVREAAGHVVAMAEQASFGRVFRLGVGLWRHPAKLAQLTGMKRRIAHRVRYGEQPLRVERATDALRLFTTDGSRERSVDADWVATGFGLVPCTRLAQLLGFAKASDARVRVDAMQRIVGAESSFAAGECTGVGGVDVALLEGEVAGLAAAGREDLARKLLGPLRRERRFGDALERAFALDPSLRSRVGADTIVCRCEDVQLADLETRSSMRDAKLQARCGMGPCQGRVCGSALEFIRGWTPDRVRSPLFPVKMRRL